MIRSPFEAIPADISSVIELVGREAREECSDHACVLFPVLNDCVASAVQRFWGSRIRTFIPLLALRDVRECIRNETCFRSRFHLDQESRS